MKPGFALNISHDSVSLLHRSERGWTSIGKVALDDPDLATALGYLREAALGLEPKGLLTKVVVPNSEILYRSITAPGPRAKARRAQIAAELDGLTPYAVEDLVFDWSGTGETVQVAAVARETLAEAEAFAVEHRFNPVSFVAIPPPGAFAAEPWFGVTEAARTVLPAGEQVQRDQDPIRIINRDGTPIAEPAVVPPAAAEAPAPPADSRGTVDTGSGVELATASEPPPVTTPADDAVDAAEPALVSLTGPDTIPSDTASAPAEPAQSAADVAAPAEHTGGAETLQPPPVAVIDNRIAGLDDEGAVSPPPAFEWVDRRGRVADRVAADVLVPEPGQNPEPAHEPEAPFVEAVDTADGPAGQLERVGAAANPALSDPVPPMPAWTPAPLAAAARASDASASAAGTVNVSPPSLSPRLAAAVAKIDRAGSPMVASNRLAKGIGRIGKAAPSAKIAKGGKPAKRAPESDTLVRNAASLTPAPIPAVAAEEAIAKPPTRLAPHTSRTAEESLGRFGGMRPESAFSRHMGLILTAVLVLLLALVAVWASFFLDTEGATGADAPVIVTKDGAAPTGTASLAVPTPRPLALAEEEETTDLALFDAPELLPEAAAENAPFEVETPAQETGATPADEPVALAGANPPVSDAEAIVDASPANDMTEMAAISPVTEVIAEPLETVEPVATARETAADPGSGDVAAAEPEVQVAPASGAAGASGTDSVRRSPAPEVTAETYLAMRDRTLTLGDAVSLPDDAELFADAAPPAALPPPPFGTVYRFDAAGNILPTPEGIVTPEGVRLVAGRPAVLPPPRPGAAPAEAPAPSVAADAATPTAPDLIATPEEPVAPVAVRPEDTFAANPALAGSRPRTRPERVEPAPVSDEGALRPPPTDGARFANLRPRLRPASTFAVADETADATPAVAPAEIAATSSMAVAISRKPAARPRDFARVVAASAAAATIRSPAGASTRAPAAIAPEEDGEPEVTTAVPSIPTRASVARQATVSRAINLDRMNLIGIYGTANNRHALVRQANGRYLKVKVGDRLDGGQVSAIGPGNLHIQKGGRTVTLEMPRG